MLSAIASARFCRVSFVFASAMTFVNPFRIDGLIRIPPTPLWAMKTAKAALDLVRLTRILSVNS